MTPVAPCQPSLHQFSLDEQEELAEMLDHYLLEWERGQPPSVTHWVRDRPEMEEALRLYIDQLNDLQDADLRSGGKANAICHQTTLMQPAEVAEQPAEVAGSSGILVADRIASGQVF